MVAGMVMLIVMKENNVTTLSGKALIKEGIDMVCGGQIWQNYYPR